MSGYDGRVKGKRFRKPQSGNSNLRERWKALSADLNDVLEGSTPRLKKPPPASYARSRRDEDRDSSRHKLHHPPAGYDIDGDGQVDIREMRLGKFLDAMIAQRERATPEGQSPPELSELERQQLRQQAGRLLIAKEFIERNDGQLWRYGSIFAEKNPDQSAEFIAGHHKFPRLMAFLESVERKRVMRSSRHVRGSLQEQAPQHDDPHSEEIVESRQTWVESRRKVNNATVSKFPLPELQPKPRERHPALIANNNDEREIFINSYGAVDLDGDGTVDDYEMRLHVRLQEAASVTDQPTATSPTSSTKEQRRQQQLDGRRFMVEDFVNRNDGKMGLYDAKYKGRSNAEIIEEIASSERFGVDFNRLRAKERVLTLKSSMGVAGCIAQLPAAELPDDPTNATEFRRVRNRSELVLARKELLKPPEQRLATLLGKNGVIPGTVQSLTFGAVKEELGRSRSERLLVGLPRIYETPRRIEPIGSFSVTKWRFEGQ